MAKLTPYQMTLVVDYRLEQEGLDTVTPQQIYHTLKNMPQFDSDSPETDEWIENYVQGVKTGQHAADVQGGSRPTRSRFARAIRALLPRHAKKPPGVKISQSELDDARNVLTDRTEFVTKLFLEQSASARQRGVSTDLADIAKVMKEAAARIKVNAARARGRLSPRKRTAEWAEVMELTHREVELIARLRGLSACPAPATVIHSPSAEGDASPGPRAYSGRIPDLVATGWSSGSPSRTGAGYGLRFTKEDRDRHFDRRWKTVLLELDGGQTITARVSDAFWRNCVELRSAGIGRWLMVNRAAPWPKGNPPRVIVTHLDGNRFRARL